MLKVFTINTTKINHCNVYQHKTRLVKLDLYMYRYTMIYRFLWSQNIILLQANINGIKPQHEELKLLIHNTCYADTITIHEPRITPKTLNVHILTAMRIDWSHKSVWEHHAC